MNENLTFPKVVLIDTVSYCNLRCSMCFHKDMKRKKGIMEWSLFKKIIDEVSRNDKSTRVWMVFFGEALILKRTKPSIFDMLSYAKRAGLKEVVLNTNGVLLDRESSEKLIDAGLDGIFIGIDAFCEETYEKIRCGGDYRRVVQNVLDLIDVKQKKGADKFKIQVQFVEMEENRRERDAFTQYWLSKGVDVKIRQKLSWAGLSGEAAGGSWDKRHECYWIMDTMSITDTGDVAICAADPEARFVAGNLARQSIREIWNGKLKEMRELHKKREWEKLPYPCNQCGDWEVSYKDRMIRARRKGVIRGRIKRYLSRFTCLAD